MTAFLIITALILLNGIFVAAEFAIVGAPRGGDRRARRARATGWRKPCRRVLRDPTQQDRYIATAQLGITVASLGLGMYGEHVLADWIYERIAGAGAPGVARVARPGERGRVAILTYFHIVVGEMVPKSLALQQAETDGALDHAADAVDQDARLPVRGGAQRHRQPAAAGCSASTGRRRTPSSTTRPRSCSSSSRRARSGARCAPSPDRCCRSCSSSAT